MAQYIGNTRQRTVVGRPAAVGKFEDAKVLAWVSFSKNCKAERFVTMYMRAYESKNDQQVEFAYKMLPCLSAAICLAQALGPLLGVSRVLLGAVSR